MLRRQPWGGPRSLRRFEAKRGKQAPAAPASFLYKGAVSEARCSRNNEFN